MNNTELRLHDVFFYGLYMDPKILMSKNVEPRNPRMGYANGYKLRVGNMATLLRQEDTKTYGLVYSLAYEEVDFLYTKSGLDMYISEALLVTLESGGSIPALCYNLLIPPADSESNSEYESKLTECMGRLNIPILND